MRRRDFIKGSLAFAALVTTNPVFSFASDKAAEKKAKVIVAYGDVQKAIARMLSHLGGIGSFVKKGDRVLLKPNFSFSNPPEAATTTTPEIVTAVTMLCKDAGAKSVTVLDNTIHPAKTSLERSGIKQALKDISNVTIAMPRKKREFEEIEVKGGKSLKKVRIAKQYFESDVLINLPIAKSHSASTVTFGLKNQMGLIYERMAFHMKYDLQQAIADLATAVRPHLTILDATRCLKTGGPGGPGEIVELGALVCSADPVALDAYAATLVEWWGKPHKPEDIKHIVYASEHGLGEIDLERIEVVKC